MKKLLLVCCIMLINTVSFAQNKPKSMKQLRDSIFAVMKLNDQNRLKMHELIAENGKEQKVIKEDQSLTEDQKKEKLATWRKEMLTKEKEILSAEELLIWKDFDKSLKEKSKQQTN